MARMDMSKLRVQRAMCRTSQPVRRRHSEGIVMSAVDKMKNAMQGARGKAKQVAGSATGHRRTEMKGRRQQVRADLKDVGEQTKDVGRKTKDAMDH
jgi:uncharacterized protein YjbJ (UPF0337 family)